MQQTPSTWLPDDVMLTKTTEGVMKFGCVEWGCDEHDIEAFIFAIEMLRDRTCLLDGRQSHFDKQQTQEEIRRILDDLITMQRMDENCQLHASADYDQLQDKWFDITVIPLEVVTENGKKWIRVNNYDGDSLANTQDPAAWPSPLDIEHDTRHALVDLMVELGSGASDTFKYTTDTHLYIVTRTD